MVIHDDDDDDNDDDDDDDDYDDDADAEDDDDNDDDDADNFDEDYVDDDDNDDDEKDEDAGTVSKVQTQIGRYQRHVLTLTQTTALLLTISISTAYIRIWAMDNLLLMKVYTLLANDILIGFFIPLAVIFNCYERILEFGNGKGTDKKTEFYISTRNILPRIDITSRESNLKTDKNIKYFSRKKYFSIKTHFQVIVENTRSKSQQSLPTILE